MWDSVQWRLTVFPLWFPRVNRVDGGQRYTECLIRHNSIPWCGTSQVQNSRRFYSIISESLHQILVFIGVEIEAGFNVNSIAFVRFEFKDKPMLALILDFRFHNLENTSRMPVIMQDRMPCKSPGVASTSITKRASVWNSMSSKSKTAPSLFNHSACDLWSDFRKQKKEINRKRHIVTNFQGYSSWRFFTKRTESAGNTAGKRKGATGKQPITP